MAVVIGLDGGGTGTSVIVEDLGSLKTLTYNLGPTNRHSVGDEKVLSTFKSLFETLFTDEGLSLEDIKSICFGGAGIDTNDDQRIVQDMFKKLGYKNHLQVVNDSMTALVGANAGKNGAIIISGTGSVALGIDRCGEPVRVGGWGHLIDDTGSAYAIARDGIRLVLEGFDGRGDHTKIWDGMKKKLGLKSPEELLDFVYDPKRQKQDIAALAPIITDLSGKDHVADQIIDKTVDDLFIHIKALSKRMETETFQVGMIGSVLEKSDHIRVRLEDKLQRNLPEVITHFPRKSPAEGAVLLAKSAMEKS